MRQSPEANRQLREVQALFIKHQPAVRAMAIVLTGDFSVAEDIVQETFITVTEKAGSFTLGTNFSAWVGTIVRYKVLQKHRLWPRLSSEVIESLTAGVSPEVEDDRLSALLTCLGEAAGTGGRGVSAGVSQLWWRYPADCRRPAGAGVLRTRGSQAEEGQDGFDRVKPVPVYLGEPLETPHVSPAWGPPVDLTSKRSRSQWFGCS